MSTENNNQKEKISLKKINNLIMSNLNTIKYVVIVLVSILVIYFGVNNYLEKQELIAHDAITLSEKVLSEKITKIIDAQKDLDKNTKSKKNKEKPVVNIFTEQNYKLLSKDIQHIETTLEAYKGSNPYLLSMYRLSEVYTQFNKTDKATEILNTIISNTKDELILAFAYLRLGTIYTDVEKNKEAIELYKKILKFERIDYLYSYVNLKIGISYQRIGNFSEAKKFYTENTEKYSKSKFTETSKNLLKLLRFKKKGV